MDDQYVAEREGEREGKLGDLDSFMTPGLSKDLQCHGWPYCSKQYGAES